MKYTLIGPLLAVIDLAIAFTSHPLTPAIRSQGTVLGVRFRSSEEKTSPGSELFPGKGGYVPSGLSREQYEKIKEDEAEKLRKMDFGSWGPRFKRTSAPDGDWMAMPSLWTNGFNSQPFGVKGDGFGEDSTNPIALFLSFCARQLPAFIMGYILVDSILTAAALCRTPTLTVRRAILTTLRLSYWSSKSIYITSFLKSQAVRSLGAIVLAPFMNRAIDVMNRRRLWGPRRTVLSTIGASLMCVLTCALLTVAIA